MKEEQFRLTKSLLAVQFDGGHCATLRRVPIGVDVRIVGSSAIVGCVEVVCEDERYHVFKEDLLRSAGVCSRGNKKESARV